MVTLVGERQIKVGYEFVYNGPLMECRDCRLKTVCFNLEEGRVYKITGVRDIRHECKIHEGGVRVVEIEKMPYRSALNQKIAVDGAIITFEQKMCKNIGCEHYRLCNPYGAHGGEKLKIVSLGEEFTCPDAGETLRKVTLL